MGSERCWLVLIDHEHDLARPALLGIRAVIAESFERIHRSNLAGMGILPLELLPGTSAASLGLTGEEVFSVRGIADGLTPRELIAGAA